MEPKPPYYSVIFSAKKRELSEQSLADYNETAGRMFELAATMPGYLGVEGAYQKDGFGITISYWESEAAIKAWRDEAEHQVARRRGKDEWYANYTLRVAKIERAYDWNNKETD